MAGNLRTMNGTTSLNENVLSLLDDSWYAQPILPRSIPSSPAVKRAGTSARGQSARTMARTSEAGDAARTASSAEKCSASTTNGKHGSEKRCTMRDSEMRAVFNRFDGNGDGFISGEELARYMRCCGADMSETEAHGMISCLDINKDGSVDFEEFLSLYQTDDSGADTGEEDEEARKEDEEAALLEAFRVFDANHDGYISAKELQAVLLSLGMVEGSSLINCERMIHTVDRDGDGQCNIQEFQEMMSKQSANIDWRTDHVDN